MAAFVENMQAYEKPNEYYEAFVDKPYRLDYFDHRYKYRYMLKEIITFCKSKGKEIVLLQIPDYENVQDCIQGRPNIYRNEHQFLSDYYHLKHFDGFEIFAGKDSNFVSQCYYQYDGHWNKKGVALFVDHLVERQFLGKAESSNH